MCVKRNFIVIRVVTECIIIGYYELLHNSLPFEFVYKQFEIYKT